jgi:hypothetical protein
MLLILQSCDGSVVESRPESLAVVGLAALCYKVLQMESAPSASLKPILGAVERAAAYGVDTTLLIENLRQPPTERLRRGEQALQSVVAFQEEARRARQQLKTRR